MPGRRVEKEPSGCSPGMDLSCSWTIRLVAIPAHSRGAEERTLTRDRFKANELSASVR